MLSTSTARALQSPDGAQPEQCVALRWLDEVRGLGIISFHKFFLWLVLIIHIFLNASWVLSHLDARG